MEITFSPRSGESSNCSSPLPSELDDQIYYSVLTPQNPEIEPNTLDIDWNDPANREFLMQFLGEKGLLPIENVPETVEINRVDEIFENLKQGKEISDSDCILLLSHLNMDCKEDIERRAAGKDQMLNDIPLCKEKWNEPSFRALRPNGVRYSFGLKVDDKQKVTNLKENGKRFPPFPWDDSGRNFDKKRPPVTIRKRYYIPKLPSLPPPANGKKPRCNTAVWKKENLPLDGTKRHTMSHPNYDNAGDIILIKTFREEIPHESGSESGSSSDGDGFASSAKKRRTH